MVGDEMGDFRKKILIDLDGVLNEYSGNYDENYIPEIKNGAKEFLEELYKTADLYLFTTRNLLLSSKWLIDNNIDKYFKDVTNTKLPSFLYIDDRCVCFNGKYDEIMYKINEFKVYWK